MQVNPISPEKFECAVGIFRRDLIEARAKKTEALERDDVIQFNFWMGRAIELAGALAALGQEIPE